MSSGASRRVAEGAFGQQRLETESIWLSVARSRGRLARCDRQGQAIRPDNKIKSDVVVANEQQEGDWATGRIEAQRRVEGVVGGGTNTRGK